MEPRQITAVDLFRRSNLKEEDLVGITLHQDGHARTILEVNFREGVRGDRDFWEAEYRLVSFALPTRVYRDRLDVLLDKPVSSIYSKGSIHIK